MEAAEALIYPDALMAMCQSDLLAHDHDKGKHKARQAAWATFKNLKRSSANTIPVNALIKARSHAVQDVNQNFRDADNEWKNLKIQIFASQCKPPLLGAGDIWLMQMLGSRRSPRVFLPRIQWLLGWLALV